jgi:hypothetical protein
MTDHDVPPLALATAVPLLIKIGERYGVKIGYGGQFPDVNDIGIHVRGHASALSAFEAAFRQYMPGIEIKPDKGRLTIAQTNREGLLEAARTWEEKLGRLSLADQATHTPGNTGPSL